MGGLFEVLNKGPQDAAQPLQRGEVLLANVHYTHGLFCGLQSLYERAQVPAVQLLETPHLQGSTQPVRISPGKNEHLTLEIVGAYRTAASLYQLKPVMHSLYMQQGCEETQ